MYTKKLIPEKSVLSNRLYVRFFCNVQTYEDASLKVMLRWQMYAGRMLYCHNGQCKSISIKHKYLSFSGVYGFIRIMLLPRMPDFTQQLLTVAKL